MRYAAVFRAVNLGPYGKISMAALRELAAKIGFDNPRTLVLSGNLVFDASGSADKIASTLEREIAKRLRVETRAFVRTAKDWNAAIDANPFPKAAADPARLHMLCLGNEPDAAAITALRERIVGRETVAVVGRQLYAIYPDGVGQSKLTLQKIEKTLGTSGTGRNWNTVLKIGAMLAD